MHKGSLLTECLLIERFVKTILHNGCYAFLSALSSIPSVSRMGSACCRNASWLVELYLLVQVRGTRCNAFAVLLSAVASALPV